MTPNQQQMTKLINDFFFFINKLEERQPGICEFFFQSKYLGNNKKQEKMLNQFYKEDKFVEFSIRLINYRNDWLLCNNDFLRENK